MELMFLRLPIVIQVNTIIIMPPNNADLIISFGQAI